MNPIDLDSAAAQGLRVPGPGGATEPAPAGQGAGAADWASIGEEGTAPDANPVGTEFSTAVCRPDAIDPRKQQPDRIGRSLQNDLAETSA